MSVYLKRQSGSDSIPDNGLDSFPPGYVEFSAADEILSITAVFGAIALVVVMLRLYVRGWMLKYYGSDDYTMVLAMILSVVVMACFAVETKYGLGKHAAVMIADPVAYMEFSKWLYVHSLIVMVAVSAVKVSIALFLMRLAQRTRNVRFLWGMIAAIVKCVKQWNVLEDPDWTVHNSFNVWNYIELNIGIIAASLPALKPLFNWFLETARAITSSGGRSGNRRPSGYNAYGSRSAALGYMKQPESSSFALGSMSRSHGEADTKMDPYVAQVSVGVKEGIFRGNV
ncbi:putative phosphatidylserine decarboxylase protein [Neofusicoccum parvum UCRNP2]|uniref:Putative phosphatidylserine decarboxylase protein n=1 Tax=Botryosphaeria parva (strain UCR-NP2) TaxID=1287680 RepID=R1ERU7_BOTPV|nr:putative phosphatidylserine decarboxylase protein [Neofusicoccum parvum UCRNP2]